MMSEKKEALYLADHESYLHLKETVTQTGFAYETYKGGHIYVADQTPA